MPRFVILTHDWPFLHWDLMLESNDELLTWRLLEQPGIDREIVAERLPNHRIAYLDYEGPVSGERGSVSRWDQGKFEILKNKTECLTARIQGKRLAGRVVISQHPDSQRDIVSFESVPGENELTS